MKALAELNQQAKDLENQITAAMAGLGGRPKSAEKENPDGPEAKKVEGEVRSLHISIHLDVCQHMYLAVSLFLLTIMEKIPCISESRCLRLPLRFVDSDRLFSVQGGE